MKLLFNKVYELPDPIPFADMVAIIPSRIKVLAKPTPIDSRFRYDNPARKLMFFALREGPLSTFRKARNAAFYNKVELSRALTLSIGHIKDTAIEVIALGPQDCPHSDCQLYPKTLVRPVDRDIEEVLLEIERSLAARPDVVQELLHYSPFSGAPMTYRIEDFLITGRDAPASGGEGKVKSIVITFPSSNRPAPPPRINGSDHAKGDLFLAGAGAYATSYVLSHLKGVWRHTVIDLNPVVVSRVRERFGFAYADTCLARGFKRLRESTRPAVVIATYHSTHVEAAEHALSSNPSAYVMLEKPPVTTRDQLTRLVSLARSGAMLEIGYNRRHAKMMRMCKAILGGRGGATVVHCIVKELWLPQTHWYYWPSQRTRIVGNLVHWIDLGVHLIGAKPSRLILAQDDCARAGDEVCLTTIFEDGSRLVVTATDRGNSLRGVQEYLDIRRGDVTIKIDDFFAMSVLEGGKSRCFRSLVREKGHAAMYEAFSRAVATRSQPVYSLRDLIVSSVLALSAAEMAETGQTIRKFGAKDFDV